MRLPLVLVLLSAVPCLFAQTATPPAQPAATPPPASSSPGYQLRVQSRLVIEDVSVMDGKGNPVTGLPRSAFHVLDNGKPEEIAGFREEATAATEAAPVATQPGVHTNATLYRGQGTLIALLLDPVGMELTDQMYLRVQALRFLQTTPPDARIAVFRANTQGVPVLLQEPTADREQLRAAINHAVPVMVRPVSSAFQNAVTELANISNYLRAVPGKKAVLWLAGQFPLYAPQEVSTFCTGAAINGMRCDPTTTNAEVEQVKQAARALEQARIAVYPIDVRGVLQGGLALVQAVNPQSDPSARSQTFVSESAKISGQYDEMDRIAKATGGRAFYSDNGITAMMNQAVHLATASYALSYQPQGYEDNGAWHTVRITVDGPYTLSYRTGYYAAEKSSTPPAGQLPAETANAGSTDSGALPVSIDAVKTGDAAPIIFSAKLMDAGRQGKEGLVKIRYSIRGDELQFEQKDEAAQARFRLAALAYNAWGDVLSHDVEIISTRYSPSQMELVHRIGTPADQTLTVDHRAQYLLLAVEDLATERVGVLTVPVAQVQAEAQPKH